MRPWLARFSFSFFIVAGWLIWECYKGSRGELGNLSQGRLILFLVGATLSVVLGVVGVRERHRSMKDDLDQRP